PQDIGRGGSRAADRHRGRLARARRRKAAVPPRNPVCGGFACFGIGGPALGRGAARSALSAGARQRRQGATGTAEPARARGARRLSQIPCRIPAADFGQQGGALAVSVARRGWPFDSAALRAADERTCSCRRARPGEAVAACAAACVRQPSARPRGRSQERATDARACRHSNDADLHPCAGGPAAAIGRDRAPAGAAKVNPGPMRHFLDFERPIAELEGKIEELRHLSTDSGLNIAEEVGRLEAQATRLLRQSYARLSPWQKVLVARHPERPHCLDYITGLVTEFVPLAGDRAFAEDLAIVGGIGRFRGRSVMVLGTEKGADTEARIRHNFGMARPEGYRKARRLMRLAERFGLPVLTFVDTNGAFPGIDAEARGQAEAIARAIETSLDIEVPLVASVVGEGGSGGAIALAAGNAVLMLEHAIYSVITPEGCASILWRDGEHAPQAAEALRLTAPELLRLGVIDRVVPEPLGGAHRLPHEAIA